MTRLSLHAGFLASSERYPDRLALEVERCALTYAELRRKAEAIAATLAHFDADGGAALTAVFAYRSVVAFSGVLGVLMRGHGYVPLNRTFPPDRTRLMLERSGCRAMVVDEASAAQLQQVLVPLTHRMVVLLPDVEDVRGIAAQFPQHLILGAGDLDSGGQMPLPAAVSPEAPAYLLFTSGSTGQPKGVMIAQRNAWSYLDVVEPRYGLTPEDRCSQTFDLTFDLSVHDMFVTWDAGACLCCPSQKTAIKPGKFITESRLTCWFSVPSIGVFMKALGMLKPGSYPELRWSLFCGEALPVEVANGWALAAPNSTMENIYGPTELTVACTGYRWNPETSPAECEQGLVPIGTPFEGMEALVVDEHLQEVPAGVPGELIMTGPQMARGYLDDPEKTAKSFLVPPGRQKRFYRTGDRVRRVFPGGPLAYLGRVDNQIKVLGHRVELGEIEFVVREESGIDGVVAVGWPMSSSGAGGIEVFLQVEEGRLDLAALGVRLAGRLPAYMAPRRIHVVPAFPLNANGKFDRRALVGRLETLHARSS